MFANLEVSKVKPCCRNWSYGPPRVKPNAKVSLFSVLQISLKWSEYHGDASHHCFNNDCYVVFRRTDKCYKRASVVKETDSSVVIEISPTRFHKVGSVSWTTYIKITVKIQKCHCYPLPKSVAKLRNGRSMVHWLPSSHVAPRAGCRSNWPPGSTQSLTSLTRLHSSDSATVKWKALQR